MYFLTISRDVKWHEESRLKAGMVSNSAGFGNKDHKTHSILRARESAVPAATTHAGRDSPTSKEEKQNSIEGT